MPHPNSLANLMPPAQPGEVRNPKGINQYTYRRDFELAIDELLKGVYEFRREIVEDSEGAQVRCLFCNMRQCNLYVGHQLYAHKACIDQIDQLTRGQVIALVTVQRGIAGDEKMLPVILDRLWPKTERREHAITEATGASTVLDKLTRIAELKRANGGDPESQPERADGGNGDIP